MPHQLLLAVAVSLLAAAPAYAAPVLEVRQDGTVLRDDPFLPPRAEVDFPPPRSASAAPSAPAHSAARNAIKRALGRALSEGQITRRERDGWLDDLNDARRTRGRLSGARRAQLSSVIATLERIAARGQLTASRMPALFLQLRRNAQFWRTSPYPASGQRVVFEGTELTFQYYPGQGLQIQPLANFGTANALWRSKRKQRLRSLLDELVEISSRRGRFTTWEYWFAFGGGSPPWMSAMAQGTAIQALSRASVLLRERSYRRVARRAIRAFSTRAPVGVRVPGRDGGSHYLIYSFSTGLRVLNAFSQTLNGLYDYATISGQARAMKLFRQGDRSLRAELPSYDTGAWTRYSLGGAEATQEYHELARDFVRNLCDRVSARIYCRRAKRFDRYLTEPPRIRLLTSRLVPRKLQYVRFRLSKRSTVRMTIRRGDTVVRSVVLNVPFGTRAFSWAPARRGEHEVSFTATSFNGTRGEATGTITVRPRS